MGFIIRFPEKLCKFPFHPAYGQKEPAWPLPGRSAKTLYPVLLSPSHSGSAGSPPSRNVHVHIPGIKRQTLLKPFHLILTQPLRVFPRLLAEGADLFKCLLLFPDRQAPGMTFWEKHNPVFGGPSPLKSSFPPRAIPRAPKKWEARWNPRIHSHLQTRSRL